MSNLNMAAKAGYKFGNSAWIGLRKAAIQKVGYKSSDKSEMCVQAWMIAGSSKLTFSWALMATVIEIGGIRNCN